jgi:phage gp36-like protein
VSYCTQQDLIDRFSEAELIQLTDRAGAADAIDTAVLGRAITDADDEINGWLAGRYDLPLSSTPDTLVRVACDIARYRLHTDSMPEIVAQRYKDAIKWLEKVGTGQVNLGLDDSGSEVASASAPEMQSDTSVFGRGADW